MHYHSERPLKFGRRYMRGQRHGRRGFGPFAAGFADGTGMGGGGFRTGRKLGAADLQLVILALLKEKARHGYDLIKALEERSGGFYVPSPGMVYPALTYLEESGLAVVFDSDGAKKLYRITPEGEARLKEDEAMAEAILVQLERIGRRMDRVREVFAAEAEDENMAQDLKSARRDLRAALRDRRRAAPEEQQRIAAILKRATEEIRSK
ncbi:MAG TPA: PadR family transcriptional regulator [Stellaceae bacterium]|nr:PadR family transcriptional regulator [Stellaceae bacterium]